MATIMQNKRRKIAALKIAKPTQKAFGHKLAKQKLVPGKSLEQIRIEAIRQLREMGVLI